MTENHGDDSFLAHLHGLAKMIGEELSFDGNGDEPSYGLEYAGQLASNFPWIYIDFKVTGRLPLTVLTGAEAHFLEACGHCKQYAQYLNTTIGNGQVRFRLIYREDMSPPGGAL